MGRPRGSRNKRKLTGDLSADLSAANFDFVAHLAQLLDAGAGDDPTPGYRVRLAAMLRMIPIMYPPQKAIDPTNTMTIPQVADLLTRFAREHGIEGPITLPAA